MRNVIITVDSAADIPDTLLKKYVILSVPIHINLNGVSYPDGVNITAEDIFNEYDKSGILPTTSALSVGEYKEFFEKLSHDSDVVHLSLGSGLSSAFSHAVIAAKEIDGVFVCDTQNVSCGMLLLTLKACELRDEGYTASEICDKLNNFTDKVRVNYILDNLDFIRHGGRCSAVAALGANLLGIKPCLGVFDNKISVVKKYRGKLSDVHRHFIDNELSRKGIVLDRAVLCYTCFSDEYIDELRRYVLSIVPFREVITAISGCTISAHCGRKCFGLLFMEE